jgi:hypothetical protein
VDHHVLGPEQVEVVGPERLPQVDAVDEVPSAGDAGDSSIGGP